MSNLGYIHMGSVFKPCGQKPGLILFQILLNFKDHSRPLKAFFGELSSTGGYRFKLCDPSWFQTEVNALFKTWNRALTCYKMPGFVSPQLSTADFIYVSLYWPGLDQPDAGKA